MATHRGHVFFGNFPLTSCWLLIVGRLKFMFLSHMVIDLWICLQLFKSPLSEVNPKSINGSFAFTLAKSIYSWLKPWLSFTLNLSWPLALLALMPRHKFSTDLLTFSFIQWYECYAHCDWCLPMIYQSTHTWLTSWETCFLCFVQHGAWFWKCWWDSFVLKQVKASVTSMTHSPVPLFCFCHILRLSAICYWTDARQNGIYLLNRISKENTLVFVISRKFFSWLCINIVTLLWEN